MASIFFSKKTTKYWIRLQEDLINFMGNKSHHPYFIVR